MGKELRNTDAADPDHILGSHPEPTTTWLAV